MATDKQSMRVELKRLCDTVPKSLFDSSHNVAVDFKDKVRAGRRVLNNPKANEQALRTAIADLSMFGS